MSWQTFRKWSRGKVAFRLEVEGWPQEWTTDPRITHASGANGRKVYPGLQYSGIRLRERAILRDAWFEVGGMTLTIKPTRVPSSRHETLQFTRDVVPVDYLGGGDGLSESDTTITTATGNVLPDGFYHTATECFRSFGDGTIARGQWSTTAQVHHTHGFEGDPEPTPIYVWPPTMQGRRAFLYAYADGDDFTNEGILIWRGVVSMPPRLERDGISWTLQIDSIASVFEQEIAGQGRVWRPRGIYHSESAPFYVYMLINGTAYTEYISGFYDTEAEFAAAVTARMASMLAAESYTRVSLSYEFVGGVPRLNVRTGSTLPADTSIDGFVMNFGAVQEGYVGYEWFAGLLDAYRNSAFGGAKTEWASLAADTAYYYDAPVAAQYFSSSVTTPFTYPLPAVRTVFGNPHWVSHPDLRSPGPYTTDLPTRLYLDGDVSAIAVDDYVKITTPAGLFSLKVLAVDTTDNFLDLDYTQLAGTNTALFLSDDTTIAVQREYPRDGNIADFIEAVTDNAKFANDGDVPFITSNDVVDWSRDVVLSIAGWAGMGFMLHREYTFAKPIPVRTIVQEEFKALAVFPRLNISGQVAAVGLPNLDGRTTATATITDADLLLPGAGLVGMFPTWEEQADGIVNTAKLRLGYKPEDDSFDELYDMSIAKRVSISEHKTRGRGEVEVAPRSRPSGVWKMLSGVGMFAGIPGIARPKDEECAQLVSGLLSALSRDYALVTIAVSYKLFGILVGDLIEITSKYIPDGTGRRGVTARRCLVVGREWNFDPSTPDHGLLTLYVPRSQSASGGYTPSGYVTSQSNVSGDTWQLNFDPLNIFNQLWSESSDGVVSKHFAAGDKVRVTQWDSETPTVVTGSVDSVAASNVVVSFDATWTPGSDGWVLGWQPDTGALTERQESFCYVADSALQLQDGTFARRFS